MSPVGGVFWHTFSELPVFGKCSKSWFDTSQLGITGQENGADIDSIEYDDIGVKMGVKEGFIPQIIRITL
ncbi:MAG: hypothetical protein MUO92_04015 [Dehalococcoidales bacterium]|nr:hypothetical protein [Dehalococcoidales bacterium]